MAGADVAMSAGAAQAAGFNFAAEKRTTLGLAIDHLHRQRGRATELIGLAAGAVRLLSP